MENLEQDKKYLKESQVRFRKTLELVILLIVASGVSFYFEINWLWKLLAIAAGFFGLTSIPELVSTLRLKKKIASK